MNRQITLLLLFITMLVACNTEPREVVVTVAVTSEVTSVAVQQITSTPEATAIPTETPTPLPAPTDTLEPVPEPTRTLSPVQLTTEAVIALAQPRPTSDAPTIADDDYVALTVQACQIVRDEYVYGDFNGQDWEAICEEYLALAANIDNQEAFWDLMENLIRELDDNHSRFVRPDRFAAEFNLPTEGSAQPWPGLAIWPAKEDTQVLLWDVCRSGPAAAAGLQRGDVVLAINGEPLEPNEEGQFERGPINEALYALEDHVTLTVLQEPGTEPTDVTVEFGSASGCDGWIYGLISESPRVGYIRVPNFGGNSDTNILDAIGLMEEDGALDGLILDIRHNPGGNSDADGGIFTQGVFGQVGKLREGATQTIQRIRGPVDWNETTLMVVLIDGNSHSASDYFAVYMKLSGRAVLVGMPTAGNTEGITGFNLADGSIIRMAVQVLQLPDGSLIEGVGVIPDIQVPLGDWGLREIPDIQLQTAIETIMEMIASGG